LKSLTRGKTTIGKNDIQQFIQTLDVSDEVKKELMRISPSGYTGVDLLANEF